MPASPRHVQSEPDGSLTGTNQSPLLQLKIVAASSGSVPLPSKSLRLRMKRNPMFRPAGARMRHRKARTNVEQRGQPQRGRGVQRRPESVSRHRSVRPASAPAIESFQSTSREISRRYTIARAHAAGSTVLCAYTASHGEQGRSRSRGKFVKRAYIAAGTNAPALPSPPPKSLRR